MQSEEGSGLSYVRDKKTYGVLVLFRPAALSGEYAKGLLRGNKH